MPLPQLLAYGQQIEIVQEGGCRATERTTEARSRLLINADGLLEWIALDVLHESEVEGRERHDPAGRPWLRHGVVHLPVLVAHCGRRGAGEVEEVVARRLGRLAFEVVALVEAVKRGLDDAWILTTLDLFL